MYYNYLVIIILNSIFIYLFSLQYFDHPQSFTLNSVYPPTVNSTFESRCPKIIHQIVPYLNDVPSGLYNTILHNIRLNPEFEYRIYDYKSAKEIFEREFEPSYLSAYIASESYQLKTDFTKLAFVHKYGGFFLDIQYICYYKFLNLLKYNNVFFVQVKKIDDMDLSLLVSHPNNPGIKKALDYARNNLINHNYCNTFKRITSGTVLRDELFNVGYLSDYAVCNIDPDHNVKLKHSSTIILKKYPSFDKENITHNLLPDVTLDYQEHLLFKETVMFNNIIG